MDDGQRTGRLFRSLHADGDLADDAIIAVDVDEAVTLRTVSLRETAPAEPDPSSDPDFEHLFAPIVAEEIVVDSERVEEIEAPAADDLVVADDLSSGEIDDDLDEQGDIAEQMVSRTSAGRLVDSRAESRLRDTGGIPGWAAVALVAGATALIALADVIVTGQIGWLTGIALVLVSVYAAWSVRPRDAYWVIVTPPLAFLLTTVTVGQVTVSEGNILVRQSLLIPFTLGRNVVWILTATVLAAVIVAIRRRRLLNPPA